MRRAHAFLLLLLAACQEEPDFDERYAAAQAEIRTTAEEMDAELVARPGSGDKTSDETKLQHGAEE